MLAAAVLAPGARADDLVELPYNNPGLEVDLGVGLWAWPMPVDYDDDGDLDLLVSCPDKPTNGVYYFENPGAGNKAKMPVFKASKRMGPTTHNFQISYVNGEPRILKPGYEYKGFKKAGFDKATKIYPRVNIHENGVRANMWRYVDFDGDGDQDIIVGVGDWKDYVWDQAYDNMGRWRNGPLHGYVYLIANEGTDAEPKYSESPEKLEAGGGVIDVFGWPSPNFGDFDGDGDLDLLCGEFLDGFTYFQNVGTRTEPVYVAGQKLMAEDGTPLAMDLQMITPTAIDWDGDEDLDLIVGDEDGRVALVENVGLDERGFPVYKQPAYFKQEADTLKFGALSTPYAYDWDGDGDEDILCGNTAGYIGFFENLGGGAEPKWAAPVYLQVDGKPFRILAGPNGSIQGPAEAKWGYTTQTVADWDGNGAPDILYNSIWGQIGRLERVDNQNVKVAKLSAGAPNRPDDGMTGPKWYWWQGASEVENTQWRTTPMAVDFDADGELDLVMLDDEGYLALYRGGRAADGAKTLANPERIFVDEDNQPLRMNERSAGRSGRTKLVVVDWDGDGRLDVLVNSENAEWFRNCEDRDGKIVIKRVGNLGKRNISGHSCSPAVCDFDADGKPDLLVGSENGRIYYRRNQDCVQYAADKVTARAAKEPAAPRAPGLVKEEFIYTMAPFPQCHASTICETSRGLVAAWFGGTKEKDPDVGIWVSYDDGAGWSKPSEVANGVAYDGHRHPTWNPVLFQPPGDAPTLLFFKNGPTPSEWWGELIVSYDRGRSWRDRRRLPEGIDGPVKNKPVLLPDGSILAPSSTEFDGWRVHFERTTDLGQTWERIGPINDGKEFNAIQPSVLFHGNGKLQVLCRSRESVITTAFSEDNGKTWGKMTATSLPNPNSGTDAVTLADGRHLLIYNHTTREEGNRNILNLAVSKDGLNWDAVMVLENEPKSEFSYPAIIQTSDGMVHITYTWKRQRVKHVVIDPAKLETTPMVDGKWPESVAYNSGEKKGS